MNSKIIVCLLIACNLDIGWSKPWAQLSHGTNYSSPRYQNWQNPQYNNENGFGSDPLTSTQKSLYPTLQPKYQPGLNPSHNYPQPSFDNNGQRSVQPNPNMYPLQPNLNNNYFPDNGQAIIPPFGDNGPNSYPIGNTRPQPTRPTNRTTPVYPSVRPIQNHNNYDDHNRYPGSNPNSQFSNNNNYDDRNRYPGSNPNSQFSNNNNYDDRNRYNPGSTPNSQFNNNNNDRNYYPGSNPNTQFNNNNNTTRNPQNPYQGSMNGGIYNGYGNQQPYDHRQQPYNPRPNDPQRPVSPYAGNSNGQSNYNSNPNNNNFISGRSSIQPSAPAIGTSQINEPQLPPDYDANGVALAPFPQDNLRDDRRLFNFQNLHNRQPSKYNDPSSTFNKDTLHVPLAPY